MFAIEEKGVVLFQKDLSLRIQNLRIIDNLLHNLRHRINPL